MKKQTHKVIRFTVKDMIKKRGFTQRQFSEETGIGYRIVCQYCTGEVPNPSVDALMIMCDTLNCELQDIMEVVEVAGPRPRKVMKNGKEKFGEKVLPRYDYKGNRIYEDESPHKEETAH